MHDRLPVSHQDASGTDEVLEGELVHRDGVSPVFRDSRPSILQRRRGEVDLGDPIATGPLAFRDLGGRVLRPWEDPTPDPSTRPQHPGVQLPQRGDSAMFAPYEKGVVSWRRNPDGSWTSAAYTTTGNQNVFSQAAFAIARRRSPEARLLRDYYDAIDKHAHKDPDAIRERNKIIAELVAETTQDGLDPSTRALQAVMRRLPSAQSIDTRALDLIDRLTDLRGLARSFRRQTFEDGAIVNFDTLLFESDGALLRGLPGRIVELAKGGDLSTTEATIALALALRGTRGNMFEALDTGMRAVVAQRSGEELLNASETLIDAHLSLDLAIINNLVRGTTLSHDEREEYLSLWSGATSDFYAARWYQYAHILGIPVHNMSQEEVREVSAHFNFATSFQLGNQSALRALHEEVMRSIEEARVSPTRLRAITAIEQHQKWLTKFQHLPADELYKAICIEAMGDPNDPNTQLAQNYLATNTPDYLDRNTSTGAGLQNAEQSAQRYYDEYRRRIGEISGNGQFKVGNEGRLQLHVTEMLGEKTQRFIVWSDLHPGGLAAVSGIGSDLSGVTTGLTERSRDFLQASIDHQVDPVTPEQRFHVTDQDTLYWRLISPSALHGLVHMTAAQSRVAIDNVVIKNGILKQFKNALTDEEIYWAGLLDADPQLHLVTGAMAAVSAVVHADADVAGNEKSDYVQVRLNSAMRMNMRQALQMVVPGNQADEIAKISRAHKLGQLEGLSQFQLELDRESAACVAADISYELSRRADAQTSVSFMRTMVEMAREDDQRESGSILKLLRPEMRRILSGLFAETYIVGDRRADKSFTRDQRHEMDELYLQIFGLIYEKMVESSGGVDKLLVNYDVSEPHAKQMLDGLFELIAVLPNRSVPAQRGIISMGRSVSSIGPVKTNSVGALVSQGPRNGYHPSVHEIGIDGVAFEGITPAEVFLSVMAGMYGSVTRRIRGVESEIIAAELARLQNEATEGYYQRDGGDDLVSAARGSASAQMLHSDHFGRRTADLGQIQAMINMILRIADEKGALKFYIAVDIPENVGSAATYVQWDNRHPALTRVAARSIVVGDERIPLLEHVQRLFGPDRSDTVIPEDKLLELQREIVS